MSIYDLIIKEENTYRTTPVPVSDGYEWGMYEKINEWVLYKDGQLKDGNIDEVPVQNIILPILNVAYRTEGFDVQNIEPYVSDPDNYHLSFIVRKYHEIYALKHRMDNLIDDIVMSYVDFGGVLVKDSDVTEVIPLQKIAFCDQTDILGGPFAIKHHMTPEQLSEREGTWNKGAIRDVIINAKNQIEGVFAKGNKAETPGKYIEVYEVHGSFPVSWLTQDTERYTDEDEYKYSRQIHIVVFCATEDPNQKRGVTLYKGREKDGLFKFLKRDKRFGTTLGRSAIEELVESQVWKNYNNYQMKQLLDKAAILLGITDDPTFVGKNKFTDLSSGEWIVKAPNTSVEPFVFPMQNIEAFQQNAIEFENYARTVGSANEATLGISPSAGTPFKLQDLVVSEGKGIHEYRRGQIASFVEEIYREWELPKMVEELNSGKTFMTEFSVDEIHEITERVVQNHVNNICKMKALSGKKVTPEQKQILLDRAKEDFSKGGTRRFATLLKGELDKIPTDVRINVAGKQKNQQAIVDKMSNIITRVLQNPAILQDKNAAKLLNATFEASGLSPIQFDLTNQSYSDKPDEQKSVPSPMQDLPTNV